jgi:hypothetical protein
MQRYITQLLEMLQEAHSNRPTPRQLYLPEDMKLFFKQIIFCYKKSIFYLYWNCTTKGNALILPFIIHKVVYLHFQYHKR